MAWEDDWAAEGLGENCVDVAIASRSLGSRSMRERLRRLDGVARHKAAITVSSGVTPSRDPRLLALLGREVDERPERVSDAVGVLCDLGRLPVVAYLPTLRPMTFATLDDGLAELRKMVGPELPGSRKSRRTPPPARADVESLVFRWGAQIDPALLDLALTHRSWAHENGGLPTNERLEFLGDSVLSIVVTENLYRTHPEAPESHYEIGRASCRERV